MDELCERRDPLFDALLLTLAELHLLSRGVDVLVPATLAPHRTTAGTTSGTTANTNSDTTTDTTTDTITRSAPADLHRARTELLSSAHAA